MSKILYFDSFNGASGDMILGALLDLGLPLELLEAELAKLGLGGYHLHVRRIERQGIRAVDFSVHTRDESTHSHPHDHHHGESAAHHHRGLSEIRALIEKSQLPNPVKNQAMRVFQRLAVAEASVHGTPVEEVHFHEVGAVDSIIDIVGACIGFHYFKIDEFYGSPLQLGGGTVTFSHGTWPVPAPATVELIADFPTRLGLADFELTTPTGAAIVTTLAQPGATPSWRIQASGFGAGDREVAEIPNLLRLMLGDAISDTNPGCEEVILLEASIDDMDGESVGHFLDLALKAGALDVFYVPLHMKKNRPGVLVTVLSRTADQDRLCELFFRHTTTLGVRRSVSQRQVLERQSVQVETDLGTVNVKVARLAGKVVNLAPEYEDIKEIAVRRNLPLKVVRLKIMQQLGSLDYE